jgi:lipoate-protein ligase A
MSHPLHILPDSHGNAADNMAYDFMMLQRYHQADAIRVRHYKWDYPSYTFGLSQKISYVISEIKDQGIELCRRPTGGGVVSHLEDWTYSIVIPSSHPLCHGQPIDSYQSVHQAVVNALQSEGVDAILNTTPPLNKTPSVCFNKPEIYDVILNNLPTKIAGAAQKRTKAGMLLQGSIWKPAAHGVDWGKFYNTFIMEIAKLMDATIEYVQSPEWVDHEIKKITDQFDSEEWNQRR